MKKTLLSVIMAVGVMLSSLSLASTPPLSFISIDCTQHGSIEVPFLLLSHNGIGARGPLVTATSDPLVMELLDTILKSPHEEWFDPACIGDEVEYLIEIAF